MSEITTIVEYLKTAPDAELSTGDNLWAWWDKINNEWVVDYYNVNDKRMAFHTPDESALVKWLVEHE